MPLTLQQLTTFQSVARHQSFSRAAQELATTQPHVSHQIKSLEEHLGVPLFVRTPGRISLTEAGEALFGQALKVTAGVHEAEKIAREFRHLDRGSVQVAATSSFGNHLLPGIIADFHRHLPRLSILAQVDNSERVWEMLESGAAELAVTTSQPPMQSRLATEAFIADDIVVLAPVSLGLVEPVTVDALAELPLVLREEGSLTLDVMRRLLEGRPVDVAAQLNGTAAVNEAVAAGVGVSLVPASSVGAWSAAGSVSVHHLEGPRLQHDYVLVHAPSRFQTSAASAFLEHLRAWGLRYRAITGLTPGRPDD